MGIVVQPGPPTMAIAMAMRGWSATDLARESGVIRLSISAAVG